MKNPRYSLGARMQPAVRTTAPTTVQPQPAAVCPVCGGLECFCRPRFFSGQLLTEEDLNRLDRYITGKNRLHNRMLTGWGVVNGMEVTCGSCNNEVVVGAGYALSPCGDDILVCQDTPVDICALVNACCNSTPTTDCGPYSSPAPQDCQDVEQKWILAICYDETPSRGVTPLRPSSTVTCCSRCNCGGSSNCGCSCHSQTAKAAPRLTPTRTAAPACEPTVICEGYKFTVFQTATANHLSSGTGNIVGNLPYGQSANALSVGGIQSQGNLGQRFLSCVSDLLVLANNLKPPANGTVQDLYNWCCSLRGAFQDFLSTHGGTACNLYDVLNQFVCPDPAQYSDPAEYVKAMSAEFGQLSGVMNRYIFECLCSSLLPPVPPASADNCVPIATVTLRRKDCRIIDICNIDRKFAVTFTSLGYWLSPLQSLVDRFRSALENLCCSGILNIQPVPVKGVANIHAQAMRSTGFVNPLQDEAANFIPRVAQAWAKRNVQSDPRAMMLDALGLAQADGSPYMSPLERANPAQSLLLDNVVMPFISNLTSNLSGQVGKITNQVTGEQAKPAAKPAAPVDDVAALKARLDELAKIVEKQQATIDQLQKRQAKK